LTRESVGGHDVGDREREVDADNPVVAVDHSASNWLFANAAVVVHHLLQIVGLSICKIQCRETFPPATLTCQSEILEEIDQCAHVIAASILTAAELGDCSTTGQKRNSFFFFFFVRAMRMWCGQHKL
jgi:hypothetical protein